ncbi:MAG: hypothetical protein EBS01_13885 [Verrucomicrobia bacterium]|nr:hypothetical protein [Verrucomicrobiota bacterium]
MRNYKTIIQEAALMAMPPAAVADFLKNRAFQNRAEAREDPVDEIAERALRGRADPLINLSLARYGRHMEVVSELFHQSSGASPIRLACLSNQFLGHSFYGQRFPEWLFDINRGDPGSAAAWLSDAPVIELCALFENPTLGDFFLRDLLERRDAWKAITDDRLRIIVEILQRNPRMKTPRESDQMNGYAEYSYNSVFDAAWKLAETAPVNEGWAFALGWLYEELLMDSVSVETPLKLAERWHIDPADEEANESQAKDHDIGYLGNMERVRKGFARLALARRKLEFTELLDSDDLAFRAAAYSDGYLNAEQLWAAYEKDGNIFLTEAINNPYLWLRWGTRKALRDITWDVVRNDKRSDLMPANDYNRIERDMREKHPDWFADEEVEPAGDDDMEGKKPAT